MVHDHDVLLPAARLDVGASKIIGVQLSDGIVDDMEFICRDTIVDGGAFVCTIFWGLCGMIGKLGGLGFVDRTPCWLCVMWPLMVSADSRKYLDVLA